MTLQKLRNQMRGGANPNWEFSDFVDMQNFVSDTGRISNYLENLYEMDCDMELSVAIDLALKLQKNDLFAHAFLCEEIDYLPNHSVAALLGNIIERLDMNNDTLDTNIRAIVKVLYDLQP